MSDGMIEATRAQSTIEALLRENRTFLPSESFRAQANVNDPQVYEIAADDPETFWANFASKGAIGAATSCS